MAMTAREAANRGRDAFNAHDIDAMAETFADDVVLLAPGGMRSEGKDACMAFFGSWIEAFPDAHVEIDGVVETDDTIVEEGTFSGTHNGVFHTPMGDIPPTGRAVTAAYVEILRFGDGTFASSHLMFDRMDLMEQLGLAPAPAAAAG